MRHEKIPLLWATIAAAGLTFAILLIVRGSFEEAFWGGVLTAAICGAAQMHHLFFKLLEWLVLRRDDDKPRRWRRRYRR